MAESSDSLVPASAGSGTLAVFEDELDLALLEGEEVLMAGRPSSGMLSVYLTMVWSLVAMITVIGLPVLPFIYFMARAYAGKHRYWLTSRRIVVTTGIIGYRARSVPLERVSDVAISCSWLERLMGMRSIVIRDMTGEAQTGASMLAVADAPEMQRKILARVHEANRRVSGDAGPGSLGAPYRNDEQISNRQVLALLEKIEENTRRE